MMRKGRDHMTNNLDLVGQRAIHYFEQKHAARERALPKSRAAIRHCANSIRAIHRHEFAMAERLLHDAGRLLAEMAEDLHEQPDVFYAGFVQDAQKEYAEAATFLAMSKDHELPL